MVVVSAMDELVHKAAKREPKPDEMKEFRANAEGKLSSSFLAKSFSSQKWFALLNQKISIGALSLDLLDFRAKRTISVTLRLRLSIPTPGDLAIESLASVKSMPKETVRTWVKDLLQTEIEKHQTEDVAVWVALNAIALEAEIEKFLLTKGFKAEAKLETEELPDNTIVIATKTFTVRPGDVDWSLPISIGMRLDHSAAAKKKPPANEEDWRRTIKNIARDYVERNETLAGVRQNREFSKRLEGHLTKSCLEFGWKISRMELTSDLTEFDKGLSDTFETEWKSHSGRVFKFKTKVELSIAPDGAALYLNAKQPTLRAWVTDSLKACFDSILFERDTDALNPDNFGEIDDELRKNLEAMASPVGFEVGLVFVEPAIPEWDYLSARQFEIAQDKYGTTNPDKDAEFSMVIEGKFPSVGPAFKASQGNRPISDLVEETAKTAARLVLQSTELEDYISHFEEFDGRIREGSMRKEPVLTELKREVSARLKGHLGFKLSDLKVRRIDTELREKLADLTKLGPRKMNLRILPELDIEGVVRPEALKVPITLKAEFAQPDRKDVVNLALRNLDPDRLWSSIEGWSTESLEGLSFEELRADTPENKRALIKRLNDEVGQKLSLRGVGISFLSIERGASEFEKMEIYKLIDAKLEEADHVRKLRGIERGHEIQALTENLSRSLALLDYLSDAQKEAIKKGSLSYDETVRSIDEALQRQAREKDERAGITSGKSDNEDGSAQTENRKNQWSEEDN